MDPPQEKFKKMILSLLFHATLEEAKRSSLDYFSQMKTTIL
jgi:hypothetical protein